jgi:hypothetical protein
MVPSTLALVAGGIQAAGSIVSGFVQSAQAKRQAEAYDANARAAEEQAEAQADATRNQAQRLRGQERAAAGGSGLALAGSSFADAMADSDTEAELDAQTQEYNGRLRARNYRASADELRADADRPIWDGLAGAGTDAIGAYGKWKELQGLGQ